MKKRILAILCVLTVLVGVLAVTTAAQQETPTFRVGYAKVDINPWVDPNDWTKGMLPIALSGYGESYARPTKGWMDDNGDGVVDDQDGLKATCIAVTDDNDKTMLFIAYDMINAADTQVKNVRQAIVQALNGAVEMDDIMMSASHSHFSPDTGVSISRAEEYFDAEMAQKMKDALATWNQRVIDQMVIAAKTAMADRRVVSKVEKSQIDASDASGYTVNGVRHYNITGYNANQTDPVLKNPTWTAGDNFGSMRDKDQYTYGSMAGYKITKVEHVTQSNDNLYMMVFSFDDGSKPILFANWRGHTTLNRHGRFYRANPGITDSLTGFDCISGDYFNAFRYRMELKGYRTSLVNGASGNINNRSRASSTTNDWSTIWLAGNLVIDGEKIPNSFKMVNGKPVFESVKLSTDESANKTLYNKSTALGRLLASIAEKGLDPTNKHAKIETCQPGTIRNMQVRYGVAPHTFGDELDGLLYAIQVFEADEAASSANNGKGLFPYSARWKVEDGGDGKLYTLNSRFHVSTIKARAGTISESVAKLEINAIMLGPNLAFVSGPGEMYDYYDAAGSTNAADNDWLELITQQYGTPFVLGYSNGSHSYIPNTKAFNYNQAWAERGLPLGRGSYGANISQVAQGSGEAMIATMKKMLQIINDPNAIRTAKCEHCNKVVDWEPLIAQNNSDQNWYGGHYYLAEDIDDPYSRVKSAYDTVCLDLNGHTFKSNHTGSSMGRAFIAQPGSVLNIMDSVGGGKVIGRGTEANYGGGVIYVYPKKESTGQLIAELNLYGGTIERLMAEGTSSSSGGAVCSEGIFNIHGGTVIGGTTGTSGGAIYTNGSFSMSGGTVIGGHANEYGGAIYGSGIFNMTGGTIRGGSARLNGQTAHFSSGATINISGGTIDGQLCLYPSRLTLSGDPVLTNLYLINSNKINVVGTLDKNASITVKPQIGFFTNANGGKTENAARFHAAEGYYISSCVSGIFAGDKWHCVCGGTKPVGHTCENVAWMPWTKTTTFPTTSGNYYLTADVTTSSETYISQGHTPYVDLNSFDITFKVPKSKAPVLEGNSWSSNTRVLSLYIDSGFVLTDSSNKPGTVSRDTSALSAEDISHISNYGLLVLINGQRDVNGDGTKEKVPASFTMYNGILDGTDSVTTGSGIISVHNTESGFHMYGGTVKGGTAKMGGAVYIANGGNATFHGGTVTGGTATSGTGDCVYSMSTNEPVVLAGNAKVENIYFTASDVTEALQIQGNYTGEATLRYSKVSSGKVIGTGVNANISNATIACANDPDMEVVLENGELKLRTIDRTIGAIIPGASSEQTFLTAQEAVNAYSTGWIILQKNDAGTLTIPAGKTVYIDLNGKNLSNVTVNGKLYVQDSLTDDFSVSDGMYGKITGTVTGAVNAVPVVDGAGYVRITESGVGQSFHRVELWISGMSLNPEQVGISYLCDFRGDERIKSNLQSFGMAFSLKGVPSVTAGSFSEDCEISEFTNFTTGAQGSCNSSTVLEGVMKKENTAADNRMNAAQSIFGRPYIKLKDGTTLLGETANYSLRDLVVMADEDPVWQTLSNEAIDALSRMYQDYKAVMKDWNIPNLKAAAQ